MPTPSETAGSVTGSTVKPTGPATGESEWTVEELKASKPTLVYFYVEGMDATNGTKDDSYKFSQSFEMGCLAEKVVEQINKAWKCKKVGLDLDADRKLEKNQARIEFWSFTKVKMGDVTLKETNLINPGPFKALLTKYQAKNAELCAKEIKRIEAEKAAEEKLVKEGKTVSK